MATLGSQAVGSVVKLNVGGTARNWIVVHHGLPGAMYDASCNGTWLLMQDIYENKAYSTVSNLYNATSAHGYLNNTFINLFDDDIKNVIPQIKIPYTSRSNSTSVSTGANGLASRVFWLSATELGYVGSYAINTEGAALAYFNGAADSKRVAYLDGTKTDYYTRSQKNDTAIDAWRIENDGGFYHNTVNQSRGNRPAITLPGELSVESDGSVTLASGAITGSVNIGGVQRELTGKGYINIGGVLRELSDSSVNIGGILESLKG